MGRNRTKPLYCVDCGAETDDINFGVPMCDGCGKARNGDDSGLQGLGANPSLNAAKLRHVDKLIKIFDLKHLVSPYDKFLLYRKLRMLETRAHHVSEDYCNGIIDTDDKLEEGVIIRGIDFHIDSIKRRLDNLLGFTKKNIPVFINKDPRGYALKIDDKYVHENNLEIETDFGGYGLVAPDVRLG